MIREYNGGSVIQFLDNTYYFPYQESSLTTVKLHDMVVKLKNRQIFDDTFALAYVKAVAIVTAMSVTLAVFLFEPMAALMLLIVTPVMWMVAVWFGSRDKCNNKWLRLAAIPFLRLQMRYFEQHNNFSAAVNLYRKVTFSHVIQLLESAP